MKMAPKTEVSKAAAQLLLQASKAPLPGPKPGLLKPRMPGKSTASKAALLLLQASKAPLPGPKPGLLKPSMPGKSMASKAALLLLQASKAPLPFKRPMGGPGTPPPENRAKKPKQYWEVAPRDRNAAVRVIVGIRREYRISDLDRIATTRRMLAALDRMQGPQSEYEKSRKVDIKRARDLVAFVGRKSPSSTYTRQPKKRNLREPIRQWSTESYKNVQKMKRYGKTPTESTGRFEAHRVVDGLNAYFKKHALRSPQMPPGEFTDGKSRYLYRGISGWSKQSIDGVLSQGKYADKGYIATSRSQKIGMGFSKGGLVFRINVFTGIPRGTPWTWFSGMGTKVRQHRNFQQGLAAEKEVLLPPGELRIVGKPFEEDETKIVDAVYVPDKGYSFRQRRKGLAEDWNSHKLPALFP